MSHASEGKAGTRSESTVELEDSSKPLLEQLLATQAEAVRWARRTDGGYTVELSGGRPETLRLRDPSGTLCATLHLGPEGVRLEVKATEIHASASERVRLEGDVVELAARQTLALRSGGAIHQQADGPHHSTAFEHRLEATHGEVALRANDDVALDGERIRLNSPPVTVPAHLRRSSPSSED
ncbi:MAG: hypothetical protein H6712_27230 [Myxococcales bacterium]|nr:hypothetical protein [Myxococcales bacterium]MCB9717571.1 hypothetical protein [Myxococcales bacterium]